MNIKEKKPVEYKPSLEYKATEKTFRENKIFNKEENKLILELRNLNKNYGNSTILENVNLKIYQNDIIGIIGPSGTGKSTLLRCINLLEEPDSGDILFHNESILNKRYNRRLYRSKVGMVFQQFNLFDNYTVLDNCTIGQIKVLKHDKKVAKDIAIKYLQQVGLAEYTNAYPKHLSGGQKQRVAIARALSMGNEVLLFDEPTSALDPEMTREVLTVMQNLKLDNVTMVIVSHEMQFIKNISNKVCFMNNGKIEAIDTSENIFENPQLNSLKQFTSKI